MTFSFQNPEIATVPIQNTHDLFPVNQIYCVGRNYAAHAEEMDTDTKKPPFFFTKPKWTIANGDVSYPENTKDLQHEVELVIAIGEKSSVFGIAVGVDLTRRDIQGKAKKDGKPWFSGKTFPDSSPVSEIFPVTDLIDYSDLEIRLKVNGDLKQTGYCKDMIWYPTEILFAMEAEIPLQPGDLIFTGTPEGVGTIIKGDQVRASIPGIVALSFTII